MRTFRTRLQLSLITLWLLAFFPLPESEACRGDGLPRKEVLDWVKGRILDSMGLQEAPKIAEAPKPAGAPRQGEEPKAEAHKHGEGPQSEAHRHGDTPNLADSCRHGEDPKAEAHKHGDAPKAEAHRHREAPKLAESHIHGEASRPAAEAPEAAEAPRHGEAPDQAEAPKHAAEAHHRHPEERLDHAAAHRRSSRHGRGDLEHRDTSEVILFPSTDSTCMDSSDSSSESVHKGVFTYYFQPSMDAQEARVTSAHFWFHAGGNVNAPLFMLTSSQELLKVSDTPDKRGDDGWTTYHIEKNLQQAITEGPFILQVRCAECECRSSETERTPFVHLHTLPKTPDRSRRAPLRIPWSPDALNLLQRVSSPGQSGPSSSNGDCHIEKLDITFAELGWDNWIVHPKEFTFSYCHGSCDNSQHSQVLGIKQCCAPVPGSMKSLRFTTTSDGGFSFKYETLPNIVPEECTCI